MSDRIQETGWDRYQNPDAWRICRRCKGSGKKHPKDKERGGCPACGGVGEVRMDA